MRLLWPLSGRIYTHPDVQFRQATSVDWFNNRRLLEPIGNIPPAEAEANYYAAQQELDMAA